MATLSPTLHKRLVRALKTCDLRMRNWSLLGQWYFAIYHLDDTYVGAVRLDDEVDRLRIPPDKGLASRERKTLECLIRAWDASV